VHRNATLSRRIVPVLSFVWGCTVLNSPDAMAQTPVPGQQKEMTAVRVKSPSPDVDGRLDDPAWKYAEFVSDFLQKEPNEGTVPPESTKVAVLYDDEAIYIGARMYARHPEAIRTDVNRRDNPGNAEQIILSLDTYHDHRTSYDFGVTAAGGRFDRYHATDEEGETDFSFDPVWRAAATVDSLGWTAEMRIPFSQLRFNKQPTQVWGINWNRWIPARFEDDFWIYTPRNESGWASRFGNLVGIENIKPSRRLEVLPYVAGNGRFEDEPVKGNPFNNGHELTSRVGGDLKLGLGPNLTLDATVDPDFGQVEADPAVVNLSAYEIEFDERRPFFTEGKDLLETEGPTYFYSRRVGGSPHGDADGDFVDMPQNTTILGAAKISGRLPSGTSIGVLTALTDREFAETYDSTSQHRGKTEVEPRAGYAVARVLQEFGEDKSTVGIVLAGVHRDMGSGNPLAPSLRRSAIAGGTDWALRFKGGAYILDGYAGFSHITGERDAILEAQRSSARYFQRPDADYVRLDSTRTSLSGYTASIRINKHNAKHWLWGSRFSLDSPGFEINDAGYQQSSDNIASLWGLAYRETRPGKIFRQYDFSFHPSFSWNYGGVRQYATFELAAEGTLTNYWHAGAGGNYQLRSQSDGATRGGPLMGTPAAYNLWCSLSNRFTAPFRYGLSSYGYRTEIGSWSYGFDLNLSARSGRRWEFSANPHYGRGVGTRQYITSDTTGHPAATYGTRYIFSAIEQSTLSAQFRLNYYFTPNISLEAYIEPFASSERYFDFGELPAAGSRDLRLYGTDGTTITRQEGDTLLVTEGAASFRFHQSDRGRLSYNSNVVLRWEFRPGSTLYLVWQQNRSGDKDPGGLVRPRSLWDAGRADGENFLAIKFSYWWAVT